MPDRRRLLMEEAAGAVALAGVFGEIPEARWDEPTVTPDGWSPITIAAHLAGWLDACADVFDAMIAGTWDPAAQTPETSASVAALNAEQAARAAALGRSDVEAAIAAARVRARVAWEALAAPTPEAWSWFEESGPNHYAKHIHDLTAWLAGVDSDPEVGALLQTEAETWVAFASLLDGLEPAISNDEGWSAPDISHHVAGWMDRATAVVSHNDGWRSHWALDRGRSTDEVNAEFLAASRDLATGAARLEMEEARALLRATLTTLSAPTADAKRAFVDSTTEHYEEHLPMLRRLTGTDGSVP